MHLSKVSSESFWWHLMCVWLLLPHLRGTSCCQPHWHLADFLKWWLAAIFSHLCQALTTRSPACQPRSRQSLDSCWVQQSDVHPLPSLLSASNCCWSVAARARSPHGAAALRWRSNSTANCCFLSIYPGTSLLSLVISVSVKRCCFSIVTSRDKQSPIGLPFAAW